MDSHAQEPATSGSNRNDILRREIVKDLAELLIQFGGLQEVGNELEKNGMFNNLHNRMSEDEASQALFDLIENFSLFGSSADYDLKQIMKLHAHERGVWAYEQVLANISNADSS